MSDDPTPDVADLLARFLDAINVQIAETRAVRTILQTFLKRFLDSMPRPRQAFGSLKADTLAILKDDVACEASNPDGQRAAAAALFHAESIFAELEAPLPQTADEQQPPTGTSCRRTA